MPTEETYILSTGCALPGPPIDNETLAARLGTNAEWADLFVGTRTRHLAVDLDTGAQRQTLAELGAEAAGRALARAGMEPYDVGFVVLGTASPDALMPATVNLIADRLGIDQVATFQLQSGCAGAVQAVAVAARALDDEHPAGLVIGGDVCAKHLDLRRDLSRLPPSELVNYMIFGDGAGAAVISRTAAPGALRLHRVLNRFTGLGSEPGQTIHWFGLADRDSGLQPVQEDYKAIEARVPGLTREIVWELLDDLGWEASSVRYLLPPQLSGRMTPRIVAELGLGEAEEISCVAETGNNGNALPFLQLDRLMDRVAPGERAIAAAVESSKWIKGGFAVQGWEAP